MQEFRVQIRSFQEAQDFIRLATAQPFRVYLVNDHQVANATSYMGIASLDLGSYLRVRTEGTDSEHAAFRKLAAAFVVE